MTPILDDVLAGRAPVWWTGGCVFATLAAAVLVSRCLYASGRIGENLHRELIARIRTWSIIVPAVLIPVALGPQAVRAATVVLGVLCAREFLRAAGLSRDPWLARVSLAVVAVLASGCVPGDFVPQTLAAAFALLAVVGLSSCDPGSFLRQVSLSAMAVAWFGICLGTLGNFATRDGGGGVFVVLWLVLCVEVNDVAAFLGGKLIKGRKLCPGISPGKTMSGAVTAIAVTTVLAGTTAGWYWESSTAWIPYALGFVISVAGQVGDLVVSGVKRSLEIKDLGALLPGHGGILDRCDSLLLASPVAYLAVSVFPIIPA